MRYCQAAFSGGGTIEQIGLAMIFIELGYSTALSGDFTLLQETEENSLNRNQS
jgi:hypothetical protein